ncbi:hypothetical protein [Devosia sp. CN2-171]|jgi:hypothetical protein|uniref:hypothetical protein n=1 Tax=Devosia sp. CN2-171 TaxID=3400909 RepID=UPI003BF8E9B6
MIPASYLYKDVLRHRWGRDIATAPTTGPEWPTPSRLRTARDLFDLAFGPRRGR